MHCLVRNVNNMCSSLACLSLMNNNGISTRSKATRTMSKNKRSSLCSQTLIFPSIPSSYHFFFLHFYLVTSLHVNNVFQKLLISYNNNYHNYYDNYCRILIIFEKHCLHAIYFSFYISLGSFRFPIWHQQAFKTN